MKITRDDVRKVLRYPFQINKEDVDTFPFLVQLEITGEEYKDPFLAGIILERISQARRRIMADLNELESNVSDLFHDKRKK